MEKLVAGDIATIEGGKEYIAFSTATMDGKDYVYLMSNFKPLEIRFARQYLDNGVLKLEVVNDQTEKQRLLELFQVNNQQ